MKSKPAQHRLTDRDGDVLNMYHLDDGLYCTVQKDGGAGTSTAGPFAPEQLRAALDEVAPAGSYARTDEPRGHDYTTCTHETDSEHWQARAIKAEKERDEARSALRARLGVLAEPRPVEVTDAMIERARQRGSEIVGALWDASVVEAMLAAALTAPARPEGAEAIEAAIRRHRTSYPGDQLGDLADLLAEDGVRVVTEERS